MPRCFVCHTILMYALSAGEVAGASTIVTIDFDAIDTSVMTTSTEAKLINYLAGFGVSISGLTQPAFSLQTGLFGLREGAVVNASSAPNALIHKNSGAVPGLVGFGPRAFTLDFGNPLTSFAFDRSGLNPIAIITSFPAWDAVALDILGNILDSVSEPKKFIFSSAVPPKTFTLNGPAITSVRFTSDYRGETFEAIIIDNLQLEIPEPSTLLLGACGLMVMMSRRRWGISRRGSR